jgi:hypothetical protein
MMPQSTGWYNDGGVRAKTTAPGKSAFVPTGRLFRGPAGTCATIHFSAREPDDALTIPDSFSLSSFLFVDWGLFVLLVLAPVALCLFLRRKRR